MANNEYVNKVLFGDTTIMDISDTTAESNDVIEGEVFYTKSGARSTGTLGDATQSTHGLMSTTDKIKLDGIDEMIGATSNADGAEGLVPAPTTSDIDKFLAGDGTWKSGGKPMVILSYGNSTWQDFINAYNNNVIVYCRASSNSNPASGSQTRMAFMAYVSDASNPTNVEFQYYRSMSSHSATAMGDEVYVYKLTNSNGGTWSVTTRKASIKEIAVASGSKLDVSWSSDKVTLSNTMTADDMPMSSSDNTTAKAAIEAKYTKPSGGIPSTDLAETYLTSHLDISGKANNADLATVATTGDYDDLINKPTIPTIPTNVSTFTNDAGYLTSHLDISGKANSADLATVATTGDYDDLSNKPTIPTNVSDLNNDSGYLVSVPVATTTSSGLISATDKTKLDSLSNSKLIVVDLDTITNTTGSYSHATSITGVTSDMKALKLDLGNPEIFHSPIQISTGTGTITLTCNNVAGSSTAKVSLLFTSDLSDITSTEFDILALRIDGKADRTDTVLDTTLSRGRKASTTAGVGSFAFGYNVEASGNYSYAEGAHTIASGGSSHAEGNSTIASNHGSHAEGGNINIFLNGISVSHYTTASGVDAHAEGSGTSASGLSSHSEGQLTKAIGNQSHVEGYYTVATGQYSHVSGLYNVIDSYEDRDEWVSGTSYSIGDKVKVTTIIDNETIAQGYTCTTTNSDAEFTLYHWTKEPKMNYVEIIGNGTADNARSNARTLDWSGNEYLNGTLYINCDEDSTGGSEVATKTDLNNITRTASTSVVSYGITIYLFRDGNIVNISTHGAAQSPNSNVTASTNMWTIPLGFRPESLLLAVAGHNGYNLIPFVLFTSGIILPKKDLTANKGFMLSYTYLTTNDFPEE